MRELGKNQRQYAKFLVISTSLLSQILSGERSPNDEVLADLRMRYVDHYEKAAGK